MTFAKTQRLNDWVAMLHHIFGYTRNYAMTPYEIHTHLVEVCGAFGKYLFKREQTARAIEFLPKMFAWGVALLKRLKGQESDLEKIILTKFPRVCPYCCQTVCACWQLNKPPLNEENVRNAYFRNASMQARTVNDFQLMFREIYQESWVKGAPSAGQVKESVRALYTRLVEELSELAEALRFYHLYPSNFDNELADFFAWWFALLSTIHLVQSPTNNLLLAEDVLWGAYPASCPVCELAQCDCRPGPVREILSKPSLTNLALIDGLTQAGNRAAFDRDLSDMQNEKQRVAMPIVCIRVDLDDFKSLNDCYSHAVGDDALKHVVNAIRQKVRLRDRVYRVGGDEFAVLCPDLSALEATGMLERVQTFLKTKPLTVATPEGGAEPKQITLSVGIDVCRDFRLLTASFENADRAAIISKKNGKDRTTVFVPSAQKAASDPPQAGGHLM